MSLSDFSKAYLLQKQNAFVPEAELKGFTVQDFKEFEAGVEKALECHRHGREPELPDMPPEMNQWCNEVKNQLADFFRAYKVFRSNPVAGVGVFTIEQFQQFETNVNGIYPGLLPVIFPDAEQMEWIQNIAAGRPDKDDKRFTENFLNDLKF
jgi:hypothetical protein